MANNREQTPNFTRLENAFNITGLDGSGKSTQIEMLMHYLEFIGLDVAYSKAYDDENKRKYGKTINFLAQKGELGNLALTGMFKIFERNQLKRTLQAISEGKIVVIDRWDESYEIYHRNRGTLSRFPRVRNALSGFAFGGHIPDQTFFLDLPYEEAQKRMEGRGVMDAFDARGAEYHNMMRDGMNQLAIERDWLVVDATQTIEEIHQLIAPAVLSQKF